MFIPFWLLLVVLLFIPPVRDAILGMIIVGASVLFCILLACLFLSPAIVYFVHH